MKDKLSQYIEQSKTEEYDLATRRISPVLEDKPYLRVPISQRDLGAFEQSWHNDTYSDNGRLNAGLRGITDRVYKEAERLKPGILDAVGIEQFSALVSMGVDKLKDNTTLIEDVARTSRASRYDPGTQSEFPTMYSMSAKALVDFLNEEIDENNIPQNVQILPLPGDGSGGSQAVMMLPEEDFLKYLSRSGSEFEALSKGVDEVPSISMSLDSTLKRDRWGDIVVPTTIRDPEQLADLLPSQYAMLGVSPQYFAMQLLDHELLVSEKYVIEDKIRLEIVVVDCSGSMFSHNRAVRALGYITNRLNKVIDGKAQIGLIFFSDYAYPMVAGYDYKDINKVQKLIEIRDTLIQQHPEMWVIDTPEKAIRAKNEFLKVYRYLAGSTDIPDAISTAYLMATAFEKYVGSELLDGPPHITIITDDDSGSNYIDIKKHFTINALVVANNPGIQRACVETGGFFGTLDAIRTSMLK